MERSRIPATIRGDTRSAPSATRQAEQAEYFRSLHTAPGILVMPNAWDALSARIYEVAGFPAVATTSAGIAASLGCRDDESVGILAMAGRLQEITRAVEIPVSADVLGGFGSEPEAVRANVRTFGAQGVVGINLEDRGDVDPTVMRPTRVAQAVVRAARQAGDDIGIAVVINARTNTLLNDPPSKTRVARAIDRSIAFLEAGADCTFVPGPTDLETIAALASRIPGPLNVLLTPQSPSLAALAQVGVARVTFGSWPMRAAYSLLRRYADHLYQEGSHDPLADNSLSHADLQDIFAIATQ